MHFAVSFGSEKQEYDLQDDTAVSDLQSQLAIDFSISPQFQKLVLKGKTIPTSTSTASISCLGIKENSKLFLLGSKDDQVASLQSHEAFLAHKSAVLAARKPTKVRSTASSSSTRFHSLIPFPEGPTTPHLEQRKAFLQRLSTDPAVLHLMNAKDRDWVVLELGELHPHRSVQLSLPFSFF